MLRFTPALHTCRGSSTAERMQSTGNQRAVGNPPERAQMARTASYDPAVRTQSAIHAKVEMSPDTAAVTPTLQVSPLPITASATPAPVAAPAAPSPVVKSATPAPVAESITPSSVVAPGAADAFTEAEAAISALTAAGRGFQKWVGAKASSSLLDTWNTTLLSTITSQEAYDACVRAHFASYQPPADMAGWLLGVALLAESLPLALTVSDCSISGFPLVFVNRKFTDVTGYDKKDCEGRNCRFLQGPGTNPESGQHLLETLRRGEDSQTMLLNYRKSGEPFENLLTMRFVRDSLGRRRFCIGFQLDLTGLQDDSGPWGKRMLADESGRKLIAEARLKMSRLILMLPQQINVGKPEPPQPMLAPGQVSCGAVSHRIASHRIAPHPFRHSRHFLRCILP